MKKKDKSRNNIEIADNSRILINSQKNALIERSISSPSLWTKSFIDSTYENDLKRIFLNRRTELNKKLKKEKNEDIYNRSIKWKQKIKKQCEEEKKKE